jgi:hypothetical protein
MLVVVSVQVINDVTGPLSNLTAYATYAYHLGLSRDYSWVPNGYKYSDSYPKNIW